MNMDYRQLANIILFLALEMLILDTYQVNSLKLGKLSLLSDDKPLVNHKNKTNEITTKAPVANKSNVVDQTKNKSLAVNLAGLELLSIKDSESKGVKENADSPGVNDSKESKVATEKQTNEANGEIGGDRTVKNQTISVNLAGLELLSIKKSNSGNEVGPTVKDNNLTTPPSDETTTSNVEVITTPKGTKGKIHLKN